MPNGRSGGFIIEKTALERMLKAMPEPIGALVALEDDPKPRPVEASEMLKLLGRCTNDRLAVEEQDHRWYIIHISNRPELIWVTVLPQAQIYLAIRELHTQWATANPDWNGWMGF